jgi:hypothetical protein
MKSREQITINLKDHTLVEGNSPDEDGLAAILFTKGVALQVIASWGGGWEHVSVTHKNKKQCPLWSEMCFVKDFFFRPDELVIQYHPAENEYVNRHQFVLHIWKPINQEIPKPPKIFV